MIATSPLVRNVSSQPSPMPRRHLARRHPARQRPRVDVLARAAIVVGALVVIAVLQTLLFLGLS